MIEAEQRIEAVPTDDQIEVETSMTVSLAGCII